MVGNKLNEVTSQIGGGSGDGEGAKAEEDPEIVAARKEQEEKRKEKHRRMEAEREKMRDGIRNKYSLHKKVCLVLCRELSIITLSSILGGRYTWNADGIRPQGWLGSKEDPRSRLSNF